MHALDFLSVVFNRHVEKQQQARRDSRRKLLSERQGMKRQNKLEFHAEMMPICTLLFPCDLG